MKLQTVPLDRVFVQKATGVVHIWRGKTLTAATPEELAFLKSVAPAKSKRKAAKKR